MLPQSGEFPPFSKLGCITAIDEIVAYLPTTDLNDLKMLLNVLSTTPDTVLKTMIKQMMAPDKWPEALASTLRMLDTGLRGIIMSLYYSGRKGPDYQGQSPLELMGVDIVRVPCGKESA